MSRSASALLLALAPLAGCGAADDEADAVPAAGTSSTRDAKSAMKRVSSDLYEMIGVKGKASDNFPGVTKCPGKDAKTHFRIYHPWSFTPAAASDIDKVLERLRRAMPERGWKIVEYGPDTSRNKNINLTADHDKKKVSVIVVKMDKDDPPQLSLDLISGCYEVPDGEEADPY
ncbi:hypothetical protein ABZ626_29570 [Streptomyces longispororuber]|uniref:hypothetical protein n=1 Tax=Streptomyces longispororuber TaxID=68230 RepID=UPI0033E4832A